MRVRLAAAVAASALGIALATPALAHTRTTTTTTTAPTADAPQPHRTPWTWPLPVPAGQRTPTIVRGFEPPEHRWQPGHRGVDLLATSGEEVLAAGDGTVSFAGVLFGCSVVAIDHAIPGRDTLRTTYEPVDALVKVGAKVAQGQPIGTIAAQATDPAVGHCAPRACLHWGLVQGFGHDAHYLDPQGLVAHRTMRLLPVWGRG